MEETNVNVSENVDVEGGAVSTEEAKEKQLTQDDFDKAITKRLARERAKWEKEYNEKIEIEKNEAKKLAKMDAEEKAKYEFEKQKKEFEEIKKAFESEKLLNETTNQLASKNLPTEFATMLKGENAETTFENIKLFEEKFNAAVEVKINDRLKGSTPKTSVVESKNFDLSKMSANEINKHWNEISKK